MPVFYFANYLLLRRSRPAPPASLPSSQFTDETTNVGIIRGGRELTVEVRLGRPTQLVPQHIDGRDPSYYICAGLVFCALSEPYLRSEYGENYEVRNFRFFVRL